MPYAEEQMSLFGPDTWSGKMYPGHSAATEEKTLPPSSKKQSGSQNRKPPLFLCLKKDGQQADASWETNGALLGEFSMHSFGECPSAAVESHLSQILEENPHPKYSLSEKACLGILNRAGRRGKKLPEPLEKALMNQSRALSKLEEAVRGGKGALIQKDKSATLSTLQDQTLIQPLPFDTTQITSPQNYSSPNHGDLCHPIASTAHPPAVVYGISSYHSNAMLSDNPNSGVYEADTARTLDSLNCGYPGCNQGGDGDCAGG